MVNRWKEGEVLILRSGARGRGRTGAKHGLTKHPERRARGTRSGAYLHPERMPRGEQHGKAKLTAADVRAIREAHASGTPARALARQYGRGSSTINHIVKRETWTHIP